MKLATQAQGTAEADDGETLPQARLRWWREILTIAVFYELYSLARNTQGSGSTSPTHAFRNARVVIKLERALGLYHEESIQKLFLSARPLMKALNVYYGTAHFAVTAGVLVWLFVRHPGCYARWRYSLAWTTLLALIGFVAFPLMPPRLISPAFEMGSYQDTLNTIGGLWNFEDGAIAKLSNQYAAMPSLHFAWSLWVCLALWPRVRSSWGRGLAVAHPVITLVAIIATANHYWLDAAAGALTLLGGWLLGGILCTRAVDRVTRTRAGAGARAGAGSGRAGPAVVVGEPGCVAELAPGPEADGDARGDGGPDGATGAVATGPAPDQAGPADPSERSAPSVPSARAG